MWRGESKQNRDRRDRISIIITRIIILREIGYQSIIIIIIIIILVIIIIIIMIIIIIINCFINYLC